MGSITSCATLAPGYAAEAGNVKRQIEQGLVTYRFASLEVAGLVHAVFTRLVGSSDLLGDEVLPLSAHHGSLLL